MTAEPRRRTRASTLVPGATPQLPEVPLPVPRILLVDDDPLWLTRLRESIDGVAGVVVATTTSGQHALDLVELVHPQVALIDLDMPTPGIGGALTAYLMRRRDPSVRIVILAEDIRDATDLRGIGAVARVAKTAPAATLHEAIGQATALPPAHHHRTPSR